MQAPAKLFYEASTTKTVPNEGDQGTHFYKFLDEVSSFGQNPKHCSGTRNTPKVKKYTIFDKKHIFLWVLALNDNKYLKNTKIWNCYFPFNKRLQNHQKFTKYVLGTAILPPKHCFSKVRNCHITLDRGHQN